MNTNEEKETGFLLIPKEWLNAITEKLDKTIKLLENGTKPTECTGDYISEDEAKRQLGRKTTWFWNLRTTGQLPFAKIGKKIFYLKEDIKKLIDKNMRKSGQENHPAIS